MRNLSEGLIKTTENSFIEKITFEKLFSICQANNFACAVYRLPNEDIKHLIIDLSAGKPLNNLHLEEMGSGFIFHPFISGDNPIRFINKDIHLVDYFYKKKIELIHSEILPEQLNKVINYSIQGENESFVYTEKQNLKSNDYTDQKKSFIELIQKSIEEIKNYQFQKVVLARSKTIGLADQFNPYHFFEALTNQYNNAFIYLTYIPDVGTWIGATPETLISIDKNRQFQTVALAATQAWRDDFDLEETTWSQKDIEEQAMVSRYIINCFKKIRLREFEEVGPRTHLSGNLVHLKTDYNVDMDAVGFPQLGTIMLELLHPTSAVCGMPKDPALKFILDNEGFDREYFSGFLGPVNVLDETKIYVNLRCMKIIDNIGKLFSGAGVILNSNPEKEWTETEIKMDTLLKVLKDLY